MKYRIVRESYDKFIVEKYNGWKFLIFTYLSWVEVGIFTSEQNAVIFIKARFGIVREITYES